MKKCTKCGVEKDESEFHECIKNAEGLRGACKSCTRIYGRQYSRRVSASAKAKYAARRKIQMMTNPDAKARKMLTKARSRSAEKKIPFTIGMADILPIPHICPALGVPMALSGVRSDQTVASLDRIIPELGYIPGNVAVISRRANAIKNDATIEELELVLAYMKRHAAKQGGIE